MRIGFFLNNLDGDFQLALYNSIRKEAAALDMDLICVQGEMFREFGTSKRYPFDSARQAGLEGILIPSSIIFYRFNKGMLPILRDLAARAPLVSIGMRLFDFPSVIIDNQKPLEALIQHLVLDHSYRKLFYLGGQPDHPHNIERERTFRKTIRDMKKTFPDITGRVFSGSFTGLEMIDYFRDYIVSHGDDPPDCILGGNDIIAINIQELLQDQADPRWRNCPVTGFDDLLQARFSLPPLTTIRQPLDDMGSIAVRTLHSLIRGKTVPAVIRVNPELVIRQSCGCARTKDTEDKQNLFLQAPTLFSYYMQPVSTLGHSLVLIQSLPEMAQHLSYFLKILFIKNFYLLLYPNPLPARLGETGLVVYKQTDYEDESCFENPQTVVVASFLSDLIRHEEGATQSWCLYYLQAGNGLLGLMAYDAPEQAYPQMNSCAIFIANTVLRLRNLESEKERACKLEREVEFRTRDLMELNDKLREEARRRQAVEAEVLRISELERLRFSMDLHDDICQRLAGISMGFQSRIVGGKDEPFFRELAEQIDETLRRTRRYAHDAFPMELDALGLYEALGSLCNLVNTETSCHCAYAWKAGDTGFLTRSQEINICRIVQEALHNVMKHSNATEAAVEVCADTEGLLIRVRDNGRGIGAEGIDTTGFHREGLGLRSMEYRAHQAGADYALKTAPDKGVCVELHIRHGGTEHTVTP
jgi:signal transduction histidine kinase/DNA-binding LacI/PurR family transcriptional regulator